MVSGKRIRSLIAIVGIVAILILTSCAAGNKSDGEPGDDQIDNGATVVTPGQPDIDDGGTGDASDDQAAPEPANNVFQLATLQVGDTVAGMTVKSITGYGDGSADPGPPTIHDVRIEFEGRATVTGTYTYHLPEDEFLGNAVCIDVDETSQHLLPRMAGDERYLWFCFENEDEAQAAFGEPGFGTATVVIDNYTIIHYPSEVWNMATLIEASANGRPFVKSVTTQPEGMALTQQYRLVAFRPLPFTTYVPDNWQIEPFEEGDIAFGVRLLAPGDYAWIEIVTYVPSISLDTVVAAARERLHGFPEISEAAGPAWALETLQAADHSGDPGNWRDAEVMVGEHAGSHFYVLNQLNLAEASDGWEPTVQAILDEWRWNDTGRPLS